MFLWLPMTQTQIWCSGKHVFRTLKSQVRILVMIFYLIFFLLNHCAGTSLYPPPLHFDHGGIYSLQVPIRSWARSMSANSIFACAAWYGLADLPRKIKHIRIHASEKENLSYLLCFLLPYVYTVWRQAKATHQNSQSDNDPVHLHSFIFFIWEKKGKG